MRGRDTVPDGAGSVGGRTAAYAAEDSISGV